MARNAGWLGDAYTASRVRKPLEEPPAPTMPTSPLGAAPGGMPSLGYSAPGATSAGMSRMPNLMPGPAPATSTPIGMPPTMPRTPYGPPHTGPVTAPRMALPPQTNPNAPPPAMPPGNAAVPPPGPGMPGYMGPGPVQGTGSYPTGFDSPANAYKGMADQQRRGENNGLFYSNQPGFAGKAWLAYLMADPYNRMITDAAEREGLDRTNTAFDASAGRMRQDALQSGAGESGVAGGMSKGMDLARGNAQAKTVRDFEQHKVDTGDKRLRELLMPYLSTYVAAKNGSQPPPQSNNTGDYLQAAIQIASLFA